ncbi:MAG: hypothetical protein NTW32_27520 [Chloroflexi bacterium]|nr:hypothetical protein [Chloroflexota bacterium]
MIEDAQKIFDFLPLEYKTQAENEYVAFLWDAFTVNYEKEKYQFAYIAYHMLFMCFVYFQLVKIYLIKPEEIKKILIFTGKAQSAIDNYEQKLQEARNKKLPEPHFNPFTLAEEPERSILGLFITIGCNRALIKKMKKIVDERNDVAHSNGNINFSSQDSVDEKIKEIIDCIGFVHESSKSVISDCFERFLIESSDPDQNEYPDEDNQVREIFVKGNYLSRKDILVAEDYPVHRLKDKTGYEFIQNLHSAITRLFPSDEIDEMPWDEEARKTVEQAMESAEWDEKNKTITLIDRMDDFNERPIFKVITNREELNDYLWQRAEDTFYNYSPRDEGEYVFHCDGETIVENALSDYEERLEEFFR